MARKKLGEILVEMGIIEHQILDKALAMQKKTNKKIGQVLQDMDVLLQEDIARALAKQFGFRYAKGLSRFRFPKQVLDLIDADTVLAESIFPLKIEKKTLHLAMVNPLNIELQNDLAFKTGLNISPCVTTSEEIKAALRKNYMVDTLQEQEQENEDRSWSVLVIDDQQMVLNTLEAILKNDGFIVYKANNGAIGLKTALQMQPHLIITDALMPRMSGKELFKVLQQNPNTIDIPVIAISGNSSPEAEFELLETGFYDFIAKPINPLRLLARVNRALKMVYQAK